MATRIVFEPGWEAHLAGDVPALLERLGEAIEADAKAAAPVLTGHLRDSIGHEVDGDTLRVGSNLHYAAPVEEGHRIVAWGHETGKLQPPQPYLRPALYRRRG
jgi:phage gpG-like protein